MRFVKGLLAVAAAAALVIMLPAATTQTSTFGVVANNTGLQYLSPGQYQMVSRAGLNAPGDMPAQSYTFNAGDCDAADDGSEVQVAPAMGHGCWHAVWGAASINASLFTVHGATDATFDRADQIVHAAGKCLNVDVTFALAANHTQTVGCYSFAPGGLLRLSAGTTTLNSTPAGVSPTQQLFDTSAGGKIVFAGGVARVFVPWFGPAAAIGTDFSGPLMAATASVSNLGAASNTEIPVDGAGLVYKVASVPVVSVSWEHPVNATLDFSTVAPYSGIPPSLVAAGLILQGSYGTPVPLQADVARGTNEVVVANSAAANFTPGQDVSVTMSPPLAVLTAPVALGDTVLNVTSTAGMYSNGMLRVDSEYIAYTATSPTTITVRGAPIGGVTPPSGRGVMGQPAATHASGASVYELDFGIIGDHENSSGFPIWARGETYTLLGIRPLCPAANTEPCTSTNSVLLLDAPFEDTMIAQRRGVQIGFVYPNTRPSHVTVSWNFLGPTTNPNLPGVPLYVGFYCHLADWVTFDGKSNYAWSSGAYFDSCNHWRQDSRALGLGPAGALATLNTDAYATAVKGDSYDWQVDSQDVGANGGVTLWSSGMSPTVRTYFGQPSHGTVNFRSTNTLCSWQDAHYGFNRHGAGRDITVRGDVNCTATGIELQGGDHMVVDATVTGWTSICVDMSVLWKFTNSDIKVRCGTQFTGSGRTRLTRPLAAGDTSMYLADLPTLGNQGTAGGSRSWNYTVDSEIVGTAAAPVQTGNGDWQFAITRGLTGSTAAAHAAGADVLPQQYQAARAVNIDTRGATWPLFDPYAGVSYLTAPYTAGATSLTVNDTTQYPVPADTLHPLMLIMEQDSANTGQMNICSYTGVTAPNTLTGVACGRLGQTDQAESVGRFVLPFAAAIANDRIAVTTTTSLPATTSPLLQQGFQSVVNTEVDFSAQYLGGATQLYNGARFSGSNWRARIDLFGYHYGTLVSGNANLLLSPTTGMLAPDPVAGGYGAYLSGNGNVILNPYFINTYNGLVSPGLNTTCAGGFMSTFSANILPTPGAGALIRCPTS